MAHYSIYQIEKEPVEKECYINESDFYDEAQSGWADWFHDLNEREQEIQIEYLSKSSGIRELFRIEGREMTFLGGDSFMEKWFNEIKTLSNELTIDSFKNDYLSTWDLEKTINQTHLRMFDRIYGFEGDYAITFGDFVWSVCKNLKPGDKLYIGGVVDFHF